MLLYRIFVIFCLLVAGRCVLQLKIGALFTSGRCCDFLSFENKASALTIAEEKLKKDGVLNNETVKFTYLWRDSYSEADNVGDTISFIHDEKVDVIFGSPESSLNLAVAHITNYYNLPHISWSSTSHMFGDKKLFPTLVRTLGPISRVGDLVVTMFQEFKWTMASLIFSDKELCTYAASGLKEKFAEQNLTLTQTITFHEDVILTDSVIDGFLNRVKQTSRVVFLCDYFTVRHFMIRACYNGMCNGDFVFIYIWARQINQTTEWKAGDKYDEVAKLAYKHLIRIAISEYNGDEGMIKRDAFRREVIERMSEPPWNSTIAQENNLPPSYATENLYEAMYLYGMWINYTIETGVNRKNGAAWLDFTKNKSFEGVGRPFDMGPDGDRIPYFWVFRYLGDEMEPVIVAWSENRNKKITYLQKFIWYTEDQNPPRDIPECGFFGEHCSENHPDPQDTITIVISACVSAVVIFGGISILGYIVRRRNMENDLLQKIWKINRSDIDMLRKTRRASQTSKAPSEFSEMSAINEIHTMVGGPHQRSNVSVAFYMSQKVVLKDVNKKGILTTLELHDLKTMRELVHDNINPFIGACFEPPSPCFLFVYCSKGSLLDILENDEIQLDTNLKVSLAMDLVQGMLFIHQSKLGSHGRLKSSNCLVDNRWMLKVTDYGIIRFLDHPFEQKLLDDEDLYKSLLWTPPEILNTINPVATKEADVYSFGIILHEIFYRMGTFAGNNNMCPKEIVGKVSKRVSPPYRPAIFPDNPTVPLPVVKLMQMCWHDQAAERPTFSVIRTFIKKNIQHGSSTNIVDLILQRLEKYANNLEELVNQRTQQLMLEQQKSDRLLYRMLPRSCAEKLKAGQSVIPEVFESATVFFSDIVGFTNISAMSTPMEIVDLLNDLYICFDNIIGRYDAYKVETIGDAYLVVSGVPKRNGNLHAGIIASMSLDIVAKVGRFRIKHLPGTDVQVRIGNHTGSCCAGIVGVSMPRYCLFGDTVNTASRMETNGAPQKVHLSEATHNALQTLGGFETEFRGEMEIKGKGLMKTYWLLAKTGKSLEKEDMKSTDILHDTG